MNTGNTITTILLVPEIYYYRQFDYLRTRLRELVLSRQDQILLECHEFFVLG
jgi:hypothetical protein